MNLEGPQMSQMIMVAFEFVQNILKYSKIFQGVQYKDC